MHWNIKYAAGCNTHRWIHTHLLGKLWVLVANFIHSIQWSLRQLLYVREAILVLLAAILFLEVNHVNFLHRKGDRENKSIFALKLQTRKELKKRKVKSILIIRNSIIYKIIILNFTRTHQHYDKLDAEWDFCNSWNATYVIRTYVGTY